ncbi:hypothetical protein HK101_010745 [Irineochytrium annulatum]|nr:hypothetical protein HK101_010745 [Irineochytrium annulatum]
MLPIRSLLSVFALVAAASAQSCPYLDASAAPVTYTAKPVFYQGQATWCYPMGSYAPTDAGYVNARTVIQPVYPDGSAAGDLLFDSTPCDSSASPLFVQLRVNVGAETAYNSLSSYQSAQYAKPYDGGDGAFNLVMVTAGSKVVDTASNPSPAPVPLLSGWYNGQKVHYFSFGNVPYYTDDQGNYATANKEIYVLEGGSVSGEALIDAASPDTNVYTGFYGKYTFTIPDGTEYAANTYKSTDLIGDAAAPAPDAVIENCPTSYIAPGLASFSAVNFVYSKNVTACARSSAVAATVASFTEVANEIQQLQPYIVEALSCTTFNPRTLRYLNGYVTKAGSAVGSIAALLNTDPCTPEAQAQIQSTYTSLVMNFANVKKFLHKVATKSKCLNGY